MPRAKASETATAAPRGDGFTIGQALSLGDKQPETEGDFERTVGRNMMTSLLSGVGSIVERGLAGGARAVEGGGSGNPFRDALEMLKLMREAGMVDDGGGGRRRGSDGESSTASILKVLMEGQTSTTKLLMEMQNKAEERTAKLIEAMGKDNKEMIRELKDELKGGKGDSATDLLAKIGVQTIQGQMSRDPLAELAHMKETLEGVLGRSLTSSETADLDKELALERVKVERERIASEERRFEKELESRGQLVGGALTALGNRRGGDEADAPDDLPRYKCGACGEEFIMRTPRPTAICPACGVMLNTSGKAEPPSPEAQGGGDGTAGQLPPPQPEPPAQAPNDDDGGPEYLGESGAAY